jgi:hypothetical protein
MEANYYSLREFELNKLDISLSGDIVFTGENFFARLNLDDNLICNGQATFTNPPQTLEQQVNIPREHLVSKEYVDSVDINGGKDFFLNYTQTDSVYTLYKTLSTTVDVVAQQSISVLALGTNLLAQFLSPSLNVSRLQAGLFSLNQYGIRTNVNQGTVQFYFQLYLFSTNTLVGTSGLSNNATNSVDLFSMVFNLTSNIEILPTERLVLKLYSVGTSTNNATVTAYFEGDYYSFLTTTLNKSSDLLGTDNTWTGQNYFDNPPNDPKEIATTDTVVFTMIDSSNTFTNDNYFLTKSSPNGSTAVATTSYCDNIVLTNYATNNSWGTHLFTNETNSSTQLATCKYVLSKVYLPNIDNVFSGLNTFPTPTANSLEPASTKYVKDKFNSFFSRDNAFTGTSTTFTKATPSLTNIATTKYMTSSFLNDLTLGANVKCQTVVSSGTYLANTSATRTIINNKTSTLLSGNNALDNQTFVTQGSTDSSTKIATTEYTQTSSFSSLLTGTNNWTLDQNFLTQTTGSSNTRIATTQFVEAMTYSMNTNTITGIHTVPTATALLGQIANLDCTIANQPNYNSFLNISNTWSGIVTFPTAVTGTSSRVVANTAFTRNVLNIDLLGLDNTWTNTITLPAVVGTTDNSTRGATTACVPSYLSVSMPSMTSAPTINFTGTCLTPSPSGALSVDARVANCNYVGTTIASTLVNVGNVGITFTGVQRCPTRLTASTLLANSAFVAGKVVQYFTPSMLSTFKTISHSWSANNFFTYALSTLDNSTLGATCSYVSENLSQSKNYLGAITFNAQPIVQRTTYPASIGQIGYTDTYNATKTGLTTGFNTLIDFVNPIPIGTYIFTVKEIVTCSGTTSALNAFNFFWGTSTTNAELNFGDFTGGGAYTLAPNMVSWGLRMGAGVTTFHRMFAVSFVNASTLVHSVRATGTLTPITSVQSIVSITRIA